MASMDLHNNVSEEVATAVSIGSNTVTVGSAVDMVDGNVYEGLEFFLTVSSYTDGDFAFDIEESDDNSVWSAPPADSVLGASTISSAGSGRIGYVGKKRYARIAITSTNVTTGASVAAQAVRHSPRHKPTA